MRYKKLQQLICRELDQTASTDEVKELQEYIARDGKARVIYETQLQMSDLLQTIPRVDPPKHLPERIMEMLRTWDIPPDMLTLEVTESAVMSDPQRALDVLGRLADMGVKLSIDDYGTGYSSLSYLKQLPVQEIKIDRSFVTEMVGNENVSVIVRATIDMAHDLGLKVTAEGIEDRATWEALVNLGCDKAQGFYMSKPLPADAFSRWLEESQWGLSIKTE